MYWAQLPFRHIGVLEIPVIDNAFNQNKRARDWRFNYLKGHVASTKTYPGA